MIHIDAFSRDIKRRLFRDASAFGAIALCLWLLGCGSATEKTNSNGDSTVASKDRQEIETRDPQADPLVAAGQALRLQNLAAAAEFAYKALVQNPDSNEAKLMVVEVESARGNHQVAADLASSIDIESRLGRKAVELHIRQLVAMGDLSDAADVLLAALNQLPASQRWRHQAWNLLNRAGRREEASQQASILCRQGEATEPELISLVRRTDSFPTVLPDGQEVTEYFEPGLGVARWYFTKQDFRRAMEELKPEDNWSFRTAAASGLYGRLLAETQSTELFPQWHANCRLDDLQELGDYWAALGAYFLDQRQFEPAARALLEAVRRNPTDRVCVQRLAKAFDALDRKDEAEEFRLRAIEIAQSERSASRMEVSAENTTRQKLMRQVMELGRPFETLAWTLESFPSNATAKRASVQQHRAALLRSEDALTMASEMGVLEIDPSGFSLEPAFASLQRGSQSSLPDTGPKNVETLAQPRLVNVASEVGLDFQWFPGEQINLESIPIHESVGGGIAVIDYDLDGWPDVYLAQGSGEPPSDACTRSNALMRNVAGQFADVTVAARVEDLNYGSGLTAGDVNQDGFPDLFVGSLGHNRLFINNGDGTFRDATDNLGLVADQFTTSLAIADINHDGLPDLFEAVYIEMEGAFVLPKRGKDGLLSQPSPLKHFAQSDRWFENMGEGSFQVRKIPREIARPGTSLGLIVTDFDGDLRNDVFVGNDVRANHLLVQSGDNQLLNAADTRGVANGLSGAANGCMGIAAGDFNRDGAIDLHITNFHQESANLYLQAQGGGFTDLAVRYGIDQISLPYVGFGTKSIDLDRNGWLDLLVTNGHIFDMTRYGEGFQMPPQYLINRGSRFELGEVDDDSGYWEKNYLGRTMATFDFDRDGALDILINHLDQPLALLNNRTKSKGKWLQFELVGTTSERDAIGAKVMITIGDQTLTQWVTSGDGYFCSDEALLDFGIGTEEADIKVEVLWPSGNRQSFDRLKPGRRYLIVESERAAYQR